MEFYTPPTNCHFNWQAANFTTPCTQKASLCAPCACFGPCLHEAHPVCPQHYGFIDGWISALHATIPHATEAAELATANTACAKWVILNHHTNN